MDKWTNGRPEHGRETFEEYFEHSLLDDDLPAYDGVEPPVAAGRRAALSLSGDAARRYSLSGDAARRYP